MSRRRVVDGAARIRAASRGERLRAAALALWTLAAGPVAVSAKASGTNNVDGPVDLAAVPVREEAGLSAQRASGRSGVAKTRK
jgi:hypothetical protein